MINKTFCVLPWVHLSINSRGYYRFCCNQSYLQKDIADGGYLDFAGYAAYDIPVEDIWNIQLYKDTRVKMLNGEELPACRRCYRQEESGIKTPRITYNEKYLETLSTPDPTGFCPTSEIKYMDLRLGNECNLMCRMCSPASSNKLIPEEKITGIRNICDSKLDEFANMDWFEKDFFWDNVMSVMGNCIELYFAGGEPALFQDRTIKLFRKCIENDTAKNIMVRFNTNATIPFDSFLEYWKEFKEIRINCSIDGFGKVNDYIRYPSNWKNIDKNLTKIYEYTLNKDYNISMVVSFTVQMYNIFGLVDLLDYLKKFNIFPAMNILNEPGHYNIRILSEEKKRAVTDMLMTWYENNREWLDENIPSYYTDKYLGTIDYMNKEDRSHLYPDFLKETRLLDELRNQKMEDYIPELS